MSIKDEKSLSNEEVLTFLLASERVAAAQTNLALRNEQREAVLLALTERYSEGGKYKVTGIDTEKKLVVREQIQFEEASPAKQEA
jgi:hypothetical protein